MKKYLLLLVSFLCFVACSKSSDSNNSEGVSRSEKNFVRFLISLPTADPIKYSRTIQTSREWAIDRLDIYQFDASSKLLEAIYEDVTLVNTGPEYGLTIQIEGDAAKNFLFIANNIPSTVNRIELPSEIGVTTEIQFRAATTPAISSSDAYISPYLMMTGELLNVNPSADGAQEVEMVRIMARIDVLNYEPTLTIESIRFLNSYSSANLFGTNYPSSVTSLNYDARTLPNAENGEGNDIQRIDEADHINYKHAMYVYPQPSVTADGPKITLSGYVRKQNGNVPWSETVELKVNQTDTDFIGIVRNYRYTIKITNSISGQGFRMGFQALPWINDEDIEYTITPTVPVLSYSGSEYINDVLTVPAAGGIFTLGISSDVEWVASYRTESIGLSSDFSTISWIDATAKSSAQNTSIIKDQLELTLEANTGSEDMEVYIRVACKAAPHKFREFKVLLEH